MNEFSIGLALSLPFHNMYNMYNTLLHCCSVIIHNLYNSHLSVIQLIHTPYIFSNHLQFECEPMEVKFNAPALYNEVELTRGRPINRPSTIPTLKPPTLTDDAVLIQSLILPAPANHPGSLVCSTFLPCSSSPSTSSSSSSSSSSCSASSLLLHPLTSLRTVPLCHDAIICLHGGGQSRHTWHSTALQLSKILNALVITVDQRGHGDSFWPRITHSNLKSYYSPTEFGADIDYLIKESHLYDPLASISSTSASASATVSDSPKRRIILIGASQGGISSLYSQAASTLISALVLVDIAPRVEAVGVERIIGFMLPTSQAGFESVDDACDAIEKYTPHRPRPLAKNVRRNLRLNTNNQRLYWRYDPYYLLSRVGILEPPTPADSSSTSASSSSAAEKAPASNSIVSQEELNQAMQHFLLYMDAESERSFQRASLVRAPCLVVRADSSDVLSESGVEKLIQVVPHAQSIDVTNAHHMVVGDAADVFTSTIVEWIQKVRTTQSTTNQPTAIQLAKL